MANTPKGKIFYAKATKGYILKVMIDSLALTMLRTVFQVSKKGFYHRNTNEAGHILFNIKFPRKNFRPYFCREKVVFDLNLKHLQKMVKNVKKKDSIIMFITKKEPKKLYLAIHPCNSAHGYNCRVETVHVTIRPIKEPQIPVSLPETFINPDGKGIKVYSFPMVIDSADFQKVKKMTGVGKTMLVEMQRNNYIAFSGDEGELYGTKLEFGEILDNPESEEENEPDDYFEDEKSEEENEPDDYFEDEKSEKENESDDYSEEETSSEGDSDVEINIEDIDDEESSKSSDEDKIKGWYNAKFDMTIFSLLMKLPGLCTQIEFYAPKIERFPLKISMQAGILGEITIYIKDKKQIALEKQLCQEKNELTRLHKTIK